MSDNRVEGCGNWPIISSLYEPGNILYLWMSKRLPIGKYPVYPRWYKRLSNFTDLLFHILWNSCPWWDECHVDGWTRGFLT